MSKNHHVDFKAIRAAATVDAVLSACAVLHTFRPDAERPSKVGTCPICHRHTFRLSSSNKRWCCWGICGTGGDVIALGTMLAGSESMLDGARKVVEMLELNPDLAPPLPLRRVREENPTRKEHRFDPFRRNQRHWLCVQSV